MGKFNLWYHVMFLQWSYECLRSQPFYSPSSLFNRSTYLDDSVNHKCSVRKYHPTCIPFTLFNKQANKIVASGLIKIMSHLTLPLLLSPSKFLWIVLIWDEVCTPTICNSVWSCSVSNLSLFLLSSKSC